MSQGTSLPHVLVVGPRTEDPSDRDWTVEHPPGCPVEHYYGYEWVTWLGLMPYHDTHIACCVQWELDANGIDSLYDPESNLEWRTWDPELSLAEKLPPGAYLIEGWWHDGAGMGEYGGQGDADGSLTLLGPAPASDTFSVSDAPSFSDGEER